MTTPREKLENQPRWAWILTAYCCCLQALFYLLTEIIVENSGGAIRTFIPKIPAIDDHIPFIPVFVLIYWYSFIFWVAAIMRITHTDKQHFANWVYAFTISEFIGFIIFCIYPTTMDRYAEGLFELANKKDFCSRLLWITYTFDGGRWGCNLFPSYHCMFSMSCYMGIRRNENIPLRKRIYSFIVVMLIFMSTLFTRQHYFIDVVGGITISIVTNLLVEKWNPGKRFMPKIMEDDSPLVLQ